MSDPDRCLHDVTLTGGPHDGRVVGEDFVYPGLTILMPRIPKDGPIVHDFYLVISGADGKLLGNFLRTEAVPEPPELPEDDEDQVPALDPQLAPYLDWPLYFPDDSVHCDKFPDCENRDCRDPESGQVYIASARRLTIRELLADIKKHAEDRQASDG